MTTEIEQLKNQIENDLKSKQGELDRKLNEINQAVEGEGDIGERLKGQFNTLSEKIQTLQNDLDQLDGKVGKAQNDQKPIAQQVKSLLENDERFKSFMAGSTSKAKVDVSDVMQKVMTVGTDFTGDVIQPDRRPGVVVPPQQRTHLRDLMTVLPTGSDIIEIPKETSYGGNAGTVAENSAKPESSAQFEIASYRVETLAHLFRMTRRMFEDTNFIANWVRTRGVQGILDLEDTQILRGSGSTPDLQGLTTAGQGFTAGVSSISNPNRYDLLSRAVTQLRNNFYRPTQILVAPNDYDAMLHEKDADNNYIFGVPVGNAQGRLTVKGVPIIDHEAVVDGDFTVVDFNLAAELYDRQQVQVQFSEEDRDNFEKNLITARIEERLANAVWQSDGIVSDSFSNYLTL
jgi:HK97 family phage major capsid protein